MTQLEDTINELRVFFDSCTINNDTKGLKEGIERAKNIISSNPSVEQSVGLHYSIATAYSQIEQIEYNNMSQEQIETTQEKYIFHFRSALDDIEKIDVDTNGLYQQLYTNAGNAYNRIGRILESIRLYDNASTKYNKFPMAIGNLGVAFHKLSLYTYEKKHIHIINYHAYMYLIEAIKNEAYLQFHGNASSYFKNIAAGIKDRYSDSFFSDKIDLGNYSFGETEEEQEYRKWITEERLFLNELNDVLLNPIVAYDYIHLPNMIYETNNIKWEFHYGLYNQIKQEYVSSRYLFYYGTRNKDDVCIADKDVTQIIIDMDVHSHSDYCIRIAFRTLYSILDRIAFFINEYYDLKIDLNKISFKSIWDKKNNYYQKVLTIRDNNFMFNTIYWLSKDIYEENYISSTKPKSKEINKLRNRMEHRYAVSTLDNSTENTDKYVYKISTNELYTKTLDLMRLVREAIIYLSFMIHLEELNKFNALKNKNEYISKLNIHNMPDELK